MDRKASHNRSNSAITEVGYHSRRLSTHPNVLLPEKVDAEFNSEMLCSSLNVKREADIAVLSMIIRGSLT